MMPKSKPGEAGPFVPAEPLPLPEPAPEKDTDDEDVTPDE